MSFAEGSAGSSSPEAAALGEVLSFFGTVADHAAGVPPGEGRRVAAVAAGMARMAGLEQQDCEALYYASLLRNAGALGNPAFAKGEALSDRASAIARWDIPAHGARICERIAALPKATPDLIRWQAECWDGTGYPDQLRWSGIPKAAQLLHVAQRYASVLEPDDGFVAITSESGRTFAPEQARTFAMWFHTNAGEIEPLDARPPDSLHAAAPVAGDVLSILAGLVDEHNGAPGRAERIARRVTEIGRARGLSGNELAKASQAALLFGIGELQSRALESAQFDALARLGIETRSTHASRAASLIETCPYLADAAPIVRARSEWYDGTGAPAGLQRDSIPEAARVLSVAIAYDAIDEAYRTRIGQDRTLPVARMETAAGSQFEPESVRALAEVLKTRT